MKDNPYILDQTLWFVPNVPGFEIQQRPKNSSIRIGLIGGKRLAQCLEYECELFLITENNYEAVLKFSQLDLLLVESVYETVTHSFCGACNEDHENKEILINLITNCKKQHIPTIFWQTKSSDYDRYYKNIVDKFDYVFCVDEKSVNYYQKFRDNVFSLKSAVQPAIHNKFINHFNREQYSIPILYNFWSDLFFSKFDKKLLETLAPHGLNITDTAIRQWKRRLYDSEQFAPFVRGFLRYDDFCNILKYTKFFLTSHISNFSSIHIEQLSMEASASGCLVVHFEGENPTAPIIKPSGRFTFKDYSSIVDCIVSLLENELYRAHYAQHDWRKAHASNTYAHRLKEISKICGINNDWNEYPCCSLICPTNKPDYIERIIDNAQKQHYPNKELLIVINSDTSDISSFSAKYKHIDWLSFTHVPEEQPIGTALNIGARKAKGELCFKIDDDDYYSSHYLEDSVYHLRCYPADVWGKPPCPWLSFESDQELYYSETRATKKPCVIPDRRYFADNRVNFGGNTIGFNKSVLRDCSFPEDCIGSADSEVQILFAGAEKNLAFFDQTGIIVERRSDKSRHNWRIDEEYLKKQSTKCTLRNAKSFALCEE